jgi:predicted transcriptional regulator
MREALIQFRADSEVALDEALERAVGAMRSGNPVDPVAVFTFSSPAQLFSVITPKRWELIEHLQKIGPSSIRGLALRRTRHQTGSRRCFCLVGMGHR